MRLLTKLWNIFNIAHNAHCVEKENCEQENCKVLEELLDYTSDNDSELCEDEIHPGSCTPENTHGSVSTVSSSQQSEIDYDSLRSPVRALNWEQRTAYDIVLKWCRDKVKSLN